MNTEKAPQRLAAHPRNIVLRQMIVCGVALCVMGAGVWTLWSDMAPYHPAEMSESGTFELQDVSRDAGGIAALD
ncbi:hypothetical protein KDD17_16305 [Sulfitobacter albidus]|uniref:Uncharacterized protein n=1 Tax=Sulfitobacter albidus TaxID=2829501 RepID=A0A975JDM0_9RHOB|nr:hypothetical protein [Sulfitobacter albidus]QUJ76422.1 hypothetical protein KDD17_16305 [Sulfitobacter albidus]